MSTDPTKGTQAQKILGWMREGRRISPVDALREFGCFRLAARIKDLRDDGVVVYSEMVESTNRYGDKVRFKEYWTVDAIGGLFA